ncbi:hypothetical protein D6C98_02253 [Aureobasidium pullulans]|uniref:BHLH domain-containing protein n=1 Tax=Aureobasidium pullulans TaxID=5580 RepID=A0A4S9ZF58_AURPU|nr:hypothetical protein D6D23_05523 [Aureobasidium pullulans]THW64239.1 hypothetical protein D6D20_03012 [Aureobasidium pullulans]THY60734.1 hypothetical protein D6C98_02253 [Aureobasidium pullulans]TIA03352.1 hypothetical protein D6C82_01915 [Aureobasidium pullulans]
MPIVSPTSLTTFPPFETHQDNNNPQHDSPLEFTFDEPFEFDSLAVKPEMAGAGSPYIKSEPTDFNFQSHQYQQSSAFNMNHHMQNGMNGNGDHAMGNSNFNSAFAPQNMSSSFNMGNSGLADDELLDGITMDDGHHHVSMNQGQFNTNNNMNQHFLTQGSMPMSMGQQHINGNNNNFYSSTPEGAPIQSPFVNDFNYGQFRPQYSVPTTGGYLNGLNAPQVHQMERKISDSRSPATPNTPGISNLHLGEPEYPATTMSQQPRAIVGHRHSSSVNNWENVSNPHSWQDVSPFGSPSNPLMQHQQHPQITEVLKSSNAGANGKIASSLPAKMENPPAFQTQEAKRKRRRESHNLVERRRRDNINERIQDLASLVPMHRLEDERVRKHLQTNAPLSPSIVATGMSPSQATSLLAGGNGRRATTTSVGTGLPMDDKDKGPNKGDILNGSVAWTRDLLWHLKHTLEENAELKARLRARGDDWSAPVTEDERRMQTEVSELMQKLIATGNLQDYSRGHGSGLRVPGHTNLAGEPLHGQEGQSNYGQSLSPGFQSGSGGISPVQGYWPSTDEPVFKEEDEFTINDL